MQVAAPGVAILSTFPMVNPPYPNSLPIEVDFDGKGYNRVQGTSQATVSDRMCLGGACTRCKQPASKVLRAYRIMLTLCRPAVAGGGGHCCHADVCHGRQAERRQDCGHHQGDRGQIGSSHRSLLHWGGWQWQLEWSGSGRDSGNGSGVALPVCGYLWLAERLGSGLTSDERTPLWPSNWCLPTPTTCLAPAGSCQRCQGAWGSVDCSRHQTPGQEGWPPPPPRWHQSLEGRAHCFTRNRKRAAKRPLHPRL